MGPKIVFLKWLLMAVAIFTCLAVTFQINGFDWINERDASKLSFIILAVFIGGTCWCGYLSWQLNSLLDSKSFLSTERYQKNLKTIEIKTDYGWYARILCTELGMLGTIIGLILGLENIIKIQSVNVDDFMQLIIQFAKDLGTAFVTTGVGLVCAILLGVQLQNLCNKIDAEKKEVSND